MHLLVILAFAIIFWRSQASSGPLVPRAWEPWATVLLVWGPPIGLVFLARRLVQRNRRRLKERGHSPEAIQAFHHRAMSVLRGGMLASFAISVIATSWPNWFSLRHVHPALQIVGDILTLLPFFAGSIALFIAIFPLEQRLHEMAAAESENPGSAIQTTRLGRYLDFHVRHQLLVTTLPLMFILFAANVVDGYEEQLRHVTGSAWAPDAALGMFAAGIFLVSPFLLVRIWKATPLPDGPVRQRLDEACRRIRLRCREILVWPSDGMMVNAAVMGLLPRLRFVLLSDGLLATMTPRQIEAVFGHEAGHVRHRHIQHFLVFAVAGWVLIAGLMEMLAQISTGGGTRWLTPGFIQSVGVGATMIVWGVGFGWLSRRFERQADLFGARCVTPQKPDECRSPCSVHLIGQKKSESPDRVCATGAAVFASALDAVAVLNGIPHEERSWRHSSIGSRIRFLACLAGDPARAAGFERRHSRIKSGLLTVAVTGSALWLYYALCVSEPLILKL